VGVRKNAENLTPSELVDLREAFETLYRIADDRGFGFFAGIHGLPLPVYCEHGTALFLPWHRAYLYHFERALTAALRRARGDATVEVGLPWWDWSSAVSQDRGLPTPFRSTADGPTNPLGAGPVVLGPDDLRLVRENLPGAISEGEGPVTLRDPEEPAELPRDPTVQRALRATTFTDFSRILESIHNGVHGWVGGAMSAAPTAAFDPVFWAHHAMIDRLWYLWQLSPRNGDPPVRLLDRPLPPFPTTVRETLDISSLGYEYAAQVIG
jgi:tyrosinase